jgi:hypothetical protein
VKKNLGEIDPNKEPETKESGRKKDKPKNAPPGPPGKV